MAIRKTTKLTTKLSSSSDMADILGFKKFTDEDDRTKDMDLNFTISNGLVVDEDRAYKRVAVTPYIKDAD
jgi:hypothetical protein